jgi:hypothetical protein
MSDRYRGTRKEVDRTRIVIERKRDQANTCVSYFTRKGFKKGGLYLALTAREKIDSGLSCHAVRSVVPVDQDPTSRGTSCKLVPCIFLQLLPQPR